MAKIDLNDYLEKLTEPEDRETVANAFRKLIEDGVYGHHLFADLM